jgi:hypothetical protein
MSLAQLSIENEVDAWRLLEQTVKGNIPIDADAFQLKIGDWPEIRLKICGARFHSSITPKMMEAFIALQKNIFRTYAKLHYNQASGKIVTLEERSALELFVEVHPGSSEFAAKLGEIGQKLVEGAINKMDARHFVILGLAGILGWTATTSWKGYLSTQAEQKKSEIQLALSKEESHRLEIMSEAARQVPYVAVAKTETEEVINKILKSSVSARNITIGGHSFTGKQIQELVRPERTPSQEIRLDGEYRILKVDSSRTDFFKVELANDKGRKFWAILQDVTVTKEKNKELLQEAEWSKKPINLMINGKEVRGEVSTAFILDVKERFINK